MLGKISYLGLHFRKGGDAAKMSAALILACALAALAVASAESPLNVVGEGLMSSPPGLSAPGDKGVRYAGPIVYTNEKPPIIYFPPPPKNAKPGFGGFSLFGKNKSPKSIKYVPMPHHDLPVLIYTSDKTPPIHMIQPPPSDGPVQHITHRPNVDFGPPLKKGLEAPSSFVPTGSLSSIYSGFPEETSGRIMTTTYEIPSTSYGTPMNTFGSLVGSSDSFSSSSIQNENIASTQQQNQQQQQQQQQQNSGPLRAIGYHLPPTVSQPFSNNQKPVFGSPSGGPRKNLPHILYSGHPPIHVFNEPDMFVQAPKHVPFKMYEDLPPKASFGPPKSSFGPPSINSFHAPISPFRRPFSAFGPPQYRPSPISYPSFRETLVTSASNNNPSSITSFGSHIPNQSSQSFESNAHVSQPYGGPSYPKGPSSYSFAPQHNSYSIGPFSIEYGPPTEPFVSYSEPSGSLSSLYGAISSNGQVSGNGPINGNEAISSYGAISNSNGLINDNGPLNSDGGISSNGAISGNGADDGWQPGPPPASSNTQESVKQESWNSQSNIGPMPGPSPMHSSVFLPPSSGGHGFSSPFSGSKLASLFSSFKFKRSKPKYAIAPKSMHKPPIIIYYGKKPPMHVYQKPEIEYGTEEISVSSVPVPLSSNNAPLEIDISNSNIQDDISISNSENIPTINAADTVDLTYEASGKSEVRVAAPEEKPHSQQQPAIIAAKPVDIFPSSELQPSIYMARNSLNTIFVSDLSGSGARAIKTYIVRDSEGSRGPAKPTPVQANESAPSGEYKREAVSSISNSDESIPIAESRISATSEIPSSSSLSEKNTENQSSNNAVSQAILIASVSSEPKQQNEQPAKQQEQAGDDAVVQLGPSSFQTNLSQAEKKAEDSSAISS